MPFQIDYLCCHAMADLVPYISCNEESKIHGGKVICDLKRNPVFSISLSLWSEIIIKAKGGQRASVGTENTHYSKPWLLRLWSSCGNRLWKYGQPSPPGRAGQPWAPAPGGFPFASVNCFPGDRFSLCLLVQSIIQTWAPWLHTHECMLISWMKDAQEPCRLGQSSPLCVSPSS